MGATIMYDKLTESIKAKWPMINPTYTKVLHPKTPLRRKKYPIKLENNSEYAWECKCKSCGNIFKVKRNHYGKEKPRAFCSPTGSYKKCHVTLHLEKEKRKEIKLQKEIEKKKRSIKICNYCNKPTGKNSIYCNEVCLRKYQAKVRQERKRKALEKIYYPSNNNIAYCTITEEFI